MKACGKTLSKDYQKLILVNLQFLYLQTVNLVRLNQTLDGQECGNALRKNGSVGNTVDAHAEYHYEGHVADSIDGTGNREIIKRALGITACAKDCRAEVVKHGKRHAGKVNTYIKACKRQHVLRSAHDDENRGRKGNSYEGKDDTADDRKGDCRVNRFGNVFLCTRAEIPCDDYVYADGEAQEDIYKQVYERRGRADCGKRVLSDETPRDDHVDGIKQKLQNAR